MRKGNLRRVGGGGGDSGKCDQETYEGGGVST